MRHATINPTTRAPGQRTYSSEFKLQVVPEAPPVGRDRRGGCSGLRRSSGHALRLEHEAEGNRPQRRRRIRRAEGEARLRSPCRRGREPRRRSQLPIGPTAYRRSTRSTRFGAARRSRKQLPWHSFAGIPFGGSVQESLTLASNQRTSPIPSPRPPDMSKGKTTGGQEAEEQMNDGQKAERQGGERQSTFADIVPWTALSWAGRLTGAAIVLSLMGTLVWAFSLSGSWYLPVGGAVAGGAIGWKDPPHRSSRADAALTDVLRGAALGCVSRRGGHPGAAGCAPRPVTEVSVEPGGQSFLSPRTTDGPARGDLPALQRQGGRHAR